MESPINRPDLSRVEHLALHDIHITVGFGLPYNPKHGQLFSTFDEALAMHDAYIALNPNMVFLFTVQMRDAFHGYFPDDSPYWVRDDNGEPVTGWMGTYLIDFTRPDVIDLIVEQAIEVSKCGLYDGIFFDWWTEDWYVLKGHRTTEEEQRARDEILRRIRENVRPDFLIMVNANRNKLRRTGEYINGVFMETHMPGTMTNQDELVKRLRGSESAILWSEENLREPRMVVLEGYAIPKFNLNSPENLAWMRAYTTMALTLSDGYVLWAQYLHFLNWYDFWDADLGRPISLRGQLYDEHFPGLYIREYTNGWAVYNHSDETRVVTFASEVQGVASGLTGTEHTLPNIDGEIYLRVPALHRADVNRDGVVNILDLVLVAQGLGTDNQEADVNGDGVVNVFDLVRVADAF